MNNIEITCNYLPTYLTYHSYSISFLPNWSGVNDHPFKRLFTPVTETHDASSQLYAVPFIVTCTMVAFPLQAVVV